MTLIVSIVTPRAVVQVIDRRLTEYRGDNEAPRVLDERANKTLVIHATDGLVALSYTGLAHVDKTPTDDWLAERVRKVVDPSPGHRIGTHPGVTDVGGIVRRLQSEIDARKDRTHAIHFVAAGFKWPQRSPGLYEPVIFSTAAKTGASPLVPHTHWRLDVMPTWMKADVFKELEQEIAAHPDDADYLEERAIHALRATAAEARAVGGNCMAVRIAVLGGDERVADARVRFLPEKEASASVEGAHRAVCYSPWILAADQSVSPIVSLGPANYNTISAGRSARIGVEFPWPDLTDPTTGKPRVGTITGFVVQPRYVPWVSNPSEVLDFDAQRNKGGEITTALPEPATAAGEAPCREGHHVRGGLTSVRLSDEVVAHRGRIVSLATSWVGDWLARAASHAEPVVATVLTALPVIFVRTEPGVFGARSQVTYNWADDIVTQFRADKRFAELISLIEQDPSAGSQVNGSLGTPSGGRGRSAEEVVISLLPASSDRGSWDGHDVAAALASACEPFDCTRLAHVTIVPVVGAMVESTVELGHGAVFGRLTDEEVQLCLETRVLVTEKGAASINLGDAGVFGLRDVRDVPKVSGGKVAPPLGPDSAIGIDAECRAAAEAVEAWVRGLGMGSGAASSLVLTGDGCLRSMLHRNPISISPTVLSQAQVDPLRELWMSGVGKRRARRAGR